jgi:glycosyltransferase involved in cell wall biosynthesis
MLRNRIYYGLKPYIPYAWRMALRRCFAARVRKRTRGVWPVLPGSERPPEGWTGWPEGKKFALVLTHDVEGPEGLAKCRELMELEESLGFRSSFNFIPAGSYRVPDELREDLVRRGFEVGIHDLKHDGFLFLSNRCFSRSAPEINRYLKEWGASGFRSGFMLTDLSWLHQLDIRYDASTFDTDPFEPKPVGHKNIFPFWVARPQDPRLKSRPPGYVELPYTLAQDSTLFLILKEKTPDIWKQKLDWIAEHGGMALLNTHPDYMAMGADLRAGRDYPLAFYADFLRHVRQKFDGAFWHARPMEVAEWYRKSYEPVAVPVGASRPFAGKKAAVVLFSYYPADPRPRREAEALVEAGMEVDLICLQNQGQASEEVVNGVNVRRVPLRRKREGKLTYLIQYSQFILRSGFALGLRSFTKKYDLVHVHNMPDILAFSGLAPKLRGAKLLLDLHDPMPELMMSIFGLPADHFLVRTLKALEKCSIWFADQVVTVNAHCKQIFSKRSCEPGKIQVVMNTPDEKIFRLCEVSVAADPDPARPFVLMFHGSLVERHGVDLAVAAVSRLRKSIPNLELRIYGQSTPFLESIMDSCRRDGLGGSVRYFGSKTLEEIVQAIGECDLGLIPNRRSIFTEINTPTRIFEYLACGKPVLAPRAPGITDYFGAQDLLFFELGDQEDLARKIEHACLHPEIVREVVERGQAVYRQHIWSREKLGLLDTVGDLLGVDAAPVAQPSEPAVAASCR